jgi:hypothetical protein
MKEERPPNQEPWTLSFDKEGDCVISGPSDLEIILREFTPAHMEPPDPPPPDLPGRMELREWKYRLADGVMLRLGSVWDPDSQQPDRHRLYLGEWVSWAVPAEFAEQLHALPRTVQ